MLNCSASRPTQTKWNRTMRTVALVSIRSGYNWYPLVVLVVVTHVHVSSFQSERLGAPNIYVASDTTRYRSKPFLTLNQMFELG